MSIKRPTIAVAAAALFAAVGSTSVSAQENCGFMYQRVMEAYQVQSPHYLQRTMPRRLNCPTGLGR
jgi:hypothetical protein